MKRSILLILLAFQTLILCAHEHYMVRHLSTDDGMSQNTVMVIMQDRQGYMWFGTWDGLNRFDGYEFRVYKGMNEGTPAHVNNRVTHIYEDAREQIWWATYGGHYYRLNPLRTRTTEMPYDSLPAKMKELMADEDIQTRVDSRGIIWQADETNGILRFRSGKWKRFTPALDSRYAGQLREHFILLEDRLGRTWINPTGGGWSYYDYDKDELVNPFKDLTNMIHTAYIDREGQMWIATYDGGVECINMDPMPYELHDLRHSARDNGEVRAFALSRNGRVLPVLKSETNVYCALESQHGMLYGIKGKGLWNTATGKQIPTTHPDIYDIEEAEDGTLYVATYGGGVNIIRWNAAKGGWTAPEVYGEGLKVRDIVAGDSILWCGTTSGLFKIDLRTGEAAMTAHYDIRAMHYCRNRLWIGTFGGGLFTLDIASPQSGLEPVETFQNIILSMTGDDRNLWFCSEKSISQLNLGTGDLYFYNVFEGQQNLYFTEAEALYAPDGMVLFGYTDGYCSFDPSQATHLNSVPPITFTHIEVGGEEQYGDTLFVGHGSHITIEFAAMDFIGADKIVYSYKMDGIDEDWTSTKDMRRLSYSNLRHGSYVFHVRSTDREGGDTDNERRIVIFVARPLWLTWWAITLYIVCALLIIALIVYGMNVYNELRRKVQVEQQVTDIKLRFFTNISHELRTPLTLIAAPVENILQTERISQSVRSQLEIVRSNSQRMLRMVNQLLEFRKVQNQKMKLKVQPTILSELVADTCANFRKEAADKHIHFEIINKTEDSLVWVDRGRMDTVLWNLLSNAFKFTPAGKSIRVIIDSKPGFLLLMVQDEGVGIAPEKRNVLFERFSSNNELNSLNTGGTGIGMNLTKELVDLHHGYIEVESELGKGTTFTVLLHTGKEHFGSDVDFIAEETPVSRTPKELTFEDKMDQLEQEQESRHTVLVVDDSKEMRQFLSNILGRDYNILTAADGEEAELIVRTKPVDLVVTDLMMPNIDGLELTQFIKKNKDLDFIPVILLTAKTAIESRLEALNEGADDYVTKPFEPEYLRARVHNLLAQREQLEQSYRQRLMRLEPQKNDETIPGDTFLAKLLDAMDKQLDNNTLTVDELVEEMNMGRTVFFNKLKSMTGLSPVEFIREMRIKRAAQLLEENKYNITEITYMVGMNDSRYFAKCFKNTYGVTPSEYRKSAMQKNEE